MTSPRPHGGGGGTFLALRASETPGGSGSGRPPRRLWGELASAMRPSPSPSKARKLASQAQRGLETARDAVRSAGRRPGSLAALVSAVVTIVVILVVLRRGRYVSPHTRYGVRGEAGSLLGMAALPRLGRALRATVGGELAEVYGPEVSHPIARLEWQLHRFGSDALAEALLPPTLRDRWNPSGRGIIIACCDGAVDLAGEVRAAWRERQRALLYALVQLIRDDRACALPIEVWHRGLEGDDASRAHDMIRAELLHFPAVRFFDASRTPNPLDGKPLSRLAPQSSLLAFALLASKLNEVLLFEGAFASLRATVGRPARGVDSFPTIDPTILFTESSRFLHHGVLAWWVPANFKPALPPPEAVERTARAKAFAATSSVSKSVERKALAAVDAAAARAKASLANSTVAWSGQLLIDKRRAWKALATAWLYATVAMRAPQRAARYGGGLGLLRIGFATTSSGLETSVLAGATPLVLGFDKGTGDTKMAFVASAFAHAVSRVRVNPNEPARATKATWARGAGCDAETAAALVSGIAFVAAASPKRRPLLYPKPIEGLVRSSRDRGSGHGPGIGPGASGAAGEAFPKLVGGSESAEVSTERDELARAMAGAERHPWQNMLWSIALVPTHASSAGASGAGSASPRLHLHLHKKFGRANVDKKGYRYCRLDQDTAEGVGANDVLEATLLRVHASIHLVDAEGEGRIGGGEERSGEA